jgi:hypothetical protein
MTVWQNLQRLAVVGDDVTTSKSNLKTLQQI